MREIKFRAWNKKNMNYSPVFNREWTNQINVQLNKRCSDTGITLMQYTGLKDKNGKEIYEGDILYHKGCKSPKEHILEVKWIDYRWKFVKKEGGHPFKQLFNHPENFEVIGNIYENPEFLTN